MANLLYHAVKQGYIDPFGRKIVAQDGTVKNDSDTGFTPEQILRMDWLCENVVGSIPAFDEILPISQKMVRELGIYRDKISDDTESKPAEKFDHLL